MVSFQESGDGKNGTSTKQIMESILGQLPCTNEATRQRQERSNLKEGHRK